MGDEAQDTRGNGKPDALFICNKLQAQTQLSKDALKHNQTAQIRSAVRNVAHKDEDPAPMRPAQEETVQLTVSSPRSIAFAMRRASLDRNEKGVEPVEQKDIVPMLLNSWLQEEGYISS
jgi:hypothetical protein